MTRRPKLRPSPRPLRVLAARRGGADRAAEVEPGRAHDLHRGRAPRDAGRGRHRPRVDVRGPEVLRGRPGRRRQAHPRGRGVRGPRVALRPEPGRERGEVLPPDPAGRERDRLPEPPEARELRPPRGLLPPASHGQAADGGVRGGRASASPGACRPRSASRSSRARTTGRGGSRASTATSSGPTTTSSRSRTTGSPTSTRSCGASSSWATSSGSRSWPRTTCTTR